MLPEMTLSSGNYRLVFEYGRKYSLKSGSSTFEAYFFGVVNQRDTFYARKEEGSDGLVEISISSKPIPRHQVKTKFVEPKVTEVMASRNILVRETMDEKTNAVALKAIQNLEAKIK